MKLATWMFMMSTIALSQGKPQNDPFELIQMEGEPVTYTSEEMGLIERYNHVLYGGRRVTAGELTPVQFIGNCTATLVGPSTLLTAGHCRSNNSTASFTVNGRRHTGRCSQHPSYNNRTLDNDFSLCEFSPKIVMKHYGSLKKRTVARAETVILNGFGAGSNGYLNVSTAPIFRVESWQYLTSGRNGVQLGGGDSGGALFANMKDLKNGPEFLIVGVNSRKSGSTSYFNRTDIPISQNWFSAYAKSKNVEICGINKDCSTAPDQEDGPEECSSKLAVVKSVIDDLIFVTDEYEKCLSNK